MIVTIYCFNQSLFRLSPSRTNIDISTKNKNKKLRLIEPNICLFYQIDISLYMISFNDMQVTLDNKSLLIYQQNWKKILLQLHVGTINRYHETFLFPPYTKSHQWYIIELSAFTCHGCSTSTQLIHLHDLLISRHNPDSFNILT